MVLEKKFVSIGGGIGSFCFVDGLRIHGVKTFDIAVVSPNKHPFTQLKKYCDSSGLTSNERLRSDSGSRPDNYWGFPGYALEEIFQNLKKLNFVDALKICWQIFSESVLEDFYTPKAKQVYRALKKESKRINWQDMLVNGEVESIKKLDDGRFAVHINSADKQEVIIANVVHLSLGHSTLGKSFGKIIYIYDTNVHNLDLIRGRVAVLGRGIAAAKAIEILLKNQNEVISIFRNGVLSQPSMAGWRLQYFNYPRYVFSGSKYVKKWTGATTPPTYNWINIISNATKTNFYKVIIDKIASINQIGTKIKINLDTNRSLLVDYLIDCTGFEKGIGLSKLHLQIKKDYDLQLTKDGGFRVNEFFEIQSLTSKNAALFVTGIGAAGNHYRPVDSFAGLQHATQKIIERLGYFQNINVKKLTVMDSTKEWFKWASNTKI